MDQTELAVMMENIPQFEELKAKSNREIDQIKCGDRDVNTVIPQKYFMDDSLGESRTEEIVYVFRGGHWVEPEIQYEDIWNSNYAYSQPSFHKGQPIGDVLLPGDTHVAIDRWEVDDWPGREITRERTITVYVVGKILTDADRKFDWALKILNTLDLSTIELTKERQELIVSFMEAIVCPDGVSKELKFLLNVFMVE